MSTPRTAATSTSFPISHATFSPVLKASLAALLAVVGVFSIFSTASALWSLWSTDQLKSIGGLIPILSFVLILRVWRSLDWEMDGTWWGLVLLACTIVLVHVRDRAIFEFVIGPSWSIFLPPHSLVAFCYTAGIVLLFGGVTLFRAALFPVILTWFVNPVPNFFTLHVDLPLQHISSLIARSFAHAMGQKLTPDQLRLMFTPEFGMFIAPGCNGIRGAITMGFIALVAGYLYKFRAGVWAAVVVAAVTLGYIFNLVRLCCLVLYYIVALHIPWLQTRAEMGDYVIGACLFFVATALLFTLIQRLNPNGDLKPPPLARRATSIRNSIEAGVAHTERFFLLRWSALAIVILLGSVSYARGLAENVLHSRPAVDEKALGRFPQHVGRYHLVREWNEYLVGGPLIFYWADYAVDAPEQRLNAAGAVLSDADQAGVPNTSGNDASVVSVGISPVLGAHDTLLCHAARGEDWLWHGNMEFATAGSRPAAEQQRETFSGSFFNDGAEQYMEATTICTGETCGQYSTDRRHFGFVYSRPDTQMLMTQSPTRPIPVLLRTETKDTAMAADLARLELTANLKNFLAGADLAVFTKPYRD